MENNTPIIVDQDMLSATDTIRRAITRKHKKVSFINTPKPYIKQKQGMDYVEYSYMREVADKEWPGWSWEIVNTEMHGSAAYVVHGRLKWYDEGIWREADMVAAHRIQKKKGSDEFVDVGNDLKAANTDTIKKAFNMYMNIADDVYRNQIDEYELETSQIQQLLDLAGNVNEDTQTIIAEKIDTREINSYNYEQSLDKLKEMK